jgi:hypothetical protein
MNLGSRGGPAVLASLSDSRAHAANATLPTMGSRKQSTSPTRAKLGDLPTSSVTARGDVGENSASELIEAPLGRNKRDPLDPHDFADGGGGGGAQRFSRARTKKLRLARR